MPRDTVLTLNLTDAERGKWWWDNRLHMDMPAYQRAAGDVRFAAFKPSPEDIEAKKENPFK